MVKTLRVTGANLQVVNGLGSTGTTNGVGNLVVGYNEFGNPNGDDRTGSHNIVGGALDSFTSSAGFVVGSQNTVSGFKSSVSGGRRARAGGNDASVSGGQSGAAPALDGWVAGSLFEDN